MGHAAIQLAVWAGATVVATVSSDEKAALARSAGAHHVVQYPDADLSAKIIAIAPSGVEHIVEVAPAQNASLDVDVLANHGSIAYYANNNGEDFTVPIVASFAKNARWQGLLLYTVGPEALAAAAEDITAALEAGALPVGDGGGIASDVVPARGDGIRSRRRRKRRHRQGAHPRRGRPDLKRGHITGSSVTTGDPVGTRRGAGTRPEHRTSEGLLLPDSIADELPRGKGHESRAAVIERGSQRVELRHGVACPTPVS